MEINSSNTIFENNQDIQTLSSIYRQISISFNDNFDEEEEKELIYLAIDKCFDKEFKQIPVVKLQDDFNLLNNKFVFLVKYCGDNHNFKKMNVVFIYFCDYFDLNYSKTFKSLHPKLQTIITNFYIKIIGKKEYQHQKEKYSEQQDFTQKTLFDLFS